MDKLEKRLTDASADLQIPGAVVVANDSTGSGVYQKAFGVSSLKEDAPRKPVSLGSILFLASATKLMTSIAALQCVEKGQFTLDEDASRVIPELKDIEVINGFDDDGKPILSKAKTPITLRHLLTHTSGFTYELMDPVLTRWRSSLATSTPAARTTVIEHYLAPLVFEPGTDFRYGYFAGLMIERANGVTLSEYISEHIWKPLGIIDMTFHMGDRPDLVARRFELSGSAVVQTMPPGKVSDSTGPVSAIPDFAQYEVLKADSGGGGVYGTMPQYAKVLQSVTMNDGKLLSSKTLDLLFEPQLSGNARKTFIESTTSKDHVLGCLEIGNNGNHALGGAVVTEDIPGRRKKGTLSWAGAANVHWWADRTAGLSGVFGTQILPFGHPPAIELHREFETAVYAQSYK